MNQLSMLQRNWQTLFIGSAFVFIVSTTIEPYPFDWLLKIIPMLMLILYSITFLQKGMPMAFILGLIFSVSGDFILSFYHARGFIFGLGAFFMAHVFYIFSFGRWQFTVKKILISLLLLATTLFFLTLLYPHLGQLKVAVIAYMIVLLLMSMGSILSTRSNNWLILGGVSFVISDSLLGFNKFYSPITNAHLLIMVSYYLAQFSLVKGFSGRFEIAEDKI